MTSAPPEPPAQPPETAAPGSVGGAIGGAIGGGEDETLGEAFWAVARRLRHSTHETTAALGLTPGQARPVSVLSKHGQMRLSELANHLRIAPRSATEVVDALEGLGLAHRAPDPADRRAVLVTLSERGQGLAESLRVARHTEAEAFFGKLSEHDRGELARILRTLRGDAT